MGMSSGGSKDGATPNINVTPLIDVLLVLLIIFMVITRSSRAGSRPRFRRAKNQQNIEVKPNPLTLVVAIRRTRPRGSA